MATADPFLAQVAALAQFLGVEDFPDEPRGLDVFAPLIERVFSEGAVILVKWDGQRTSPADAPPFMAMISGPRLGDEFLRSDAASPEAALACVLVRYGEARWGFQAQR